MGGFPMDHRIDIKRHDGKVDVVYRDSSPGSREREWSGHEESRETEDSLRTIAQWFLVRHHAVKTDTMTVYDDKAIYDKSDGRPDHSECWSSSRPRPCVVADPHGGPAG
jgi:hypothetical protein